MDNLVAQICKNGHVVSSYRPDPSAKFCSKCSEETITQCCNPDCKGNIEPGNYSSTYIGGCVLTSENPDSGWEKPKFCKFCGKPFPWTERTLLEACDFIGECEELSKEEKESFKDCLPHLISEDAKTPISEVKYKKYSDKCGIVVKEALKKILFALVVEGSKKMIFSC